MASNGFEWVDDKNSEKGCFLEVDLGIQKMCLIFMEIYHFYLKERKSENVISLFVTFMAKKLFCSHKGF